MGLLEKGEGVSLKHEDRTIDSQTQLYGVLGNPIRQSLSPQLHNAAFKQLGMNCAYMAFEVDPNALALAFEGIRSLGIRGVNLTIPFKELALDFIDEIPEDLDRATGAINTVVNKDGQLLGFNTDGPGLLRALKEELNFNPDGKSILILGAGGAARGALFALARANADIVRIHNRTAERAEGLAEYAQTYFPETEISAASAEDVSRERFDLVLNATSVGMKSQHSPMELKNLHQPKAAYDLVYTPRETVWLKEAKKLGIPCANGLGMLANQAALSFELWTGRNDAVREIMHKELLNCLTS